MPKSVCVQEVGRYLNCITVAQAVIKDTYTRCVGIDFYNDTSQCHLGRILWC
jgi:hypothetical protein